MGGETGGVGREGGKGVGREREGRRCKGVCVCGDGNEAGKHRESRHFAATNQSVGQRSNEPAANNIIFRASKLQAKHKQLQLRLVYVPRSALRVARDRSRARVSQ